MTSLLGIILLLYTCYEVLVAETDSILFTEYLWFDISRWKNPILYWLTILLQTAVGVGLIVSGLTES